MTAFELFEHLPDPLSEIGEILDLADNIIFTTGLLPATAPKVNEWWYYCPQTGQHIVFIHPKHWKPLRRILTGITYIMVIFMLLLKKNTSMEMDTLL